MLDNSLLYNSEQYLTGRALALTTGITEDQLIAAESAFNILDLFTGKEVPRGVVEIMRQPEFCFWASRHLLHLNITPQHALILSEMWARPFPMLVASRGWSKTWSNAMLALLKMRMEPGTRIVGIGSSFRQSKMIWDYMRVIWEKADVLRSTCGRNDGPRMHTDRATFTIGDSTAVFIPIGAHGDKIRGLRANCILVDEFDALNPEIYETVVVGFGAVSKDPVMNAVLKARRKKMIELGTWSDDLEDRFGTQDINQQIITGTAGYGFGHFYKYYERYRQIIFNDHKPEPGEEKADYSSSRHNYSITRLPYDLIPEGFMDSATIERAKQSMLKSHFDMEYMATFAKDSDGFFKRSLVEGATCPVTVGDDEVRFKPALQGSQEKTYVYGIDPASEDDNLAVVVLEIEEKYSKVVHCWTINKKKHSKRVKAGLAEENDYFQYCAGKVRDLMRVFPAGRIMIDAQGGGNAFREAFASPPNESDVRILEVIDLDKPKDTDDISGLHILEMCQFANNKWLAGANHGMKFDLENRLLLFPEFDYIELAAVSEIENDRAKKAGVELDNISLYDTLEDCYLEIEELKRELCSIVHTKTNSGTERWNTPSAATKGASQKKDRYSALVIANQGARQMARTLAAPPRMASMGYALGSKISVEKSSQQLYNQSWYGNF